MNENTILNFKHFYVYLMFTDEWVRSTFLLKTNTNPNKMYNLKKFKLNSNTCVYIELMTSMMLVAHVWWVQRINIGGLLSNHLSNNRKNNNGTFSFHSTFYPFWQGCCEQLRKHESSKLKISCFVFLNRSIFFSIARIMKEKIKSLIIWWNSLQKNMA